MNNHALTAMGIDIFAGGYTVGVRQHFDVLAHLEENTYGVKSTKLNFPHMPVYVGQSRWNSAVDWIKRNYGHVNFVYANPPCAVWSVAGSCMRGGRDAWKSDPRLSCWRACFGAFRYTQPDAYACESVTRAFTAGREFMDELAAAAVELGYSVTHLLIDAQYLGVPQRRKRYFFVAHKYEINWVNPNWAPPMTVWEALADVDHPGEVLEIKNESQRNLIPLLKPGEALRPLWEQHNPEETWERTSFGVKGRPRMFVHRVEGDKPMGTITGDYFIHPTEHRFMGGRELRRLNGFPLDYRFEGRPQYHASFLARGVCPPVGEWLARNIRAGIERGQPIDQPRVRTVDLSRPPPELKMAG